MRHLIAMLVGLAGACATGCGAAELAGDGMTLQVYDVRDLHVPRDFPGMDFPGTEVKLEEAGLPSASEVSQANGAGTIAAALRALPGLDWAAPRSVEATAGTLVVRQDAPGHARIAGWLRDCRAACSRLVSVETWFLARPGESPAAESGLHALDSADGEAFLADARRDAGADLISAPRLTLFDGQRGNVSMTNQVSYVSGYEVAAGPGGAGDPDPVVKTVQEGQVLEVRGAIGPDGRVSLRIDTQLAKLLKPIATRQTPHGVVQTPDVRVQRQVGDATLSDGGWALLPGLQEIGDAGPTGRRIDVLLRTRVAHLDADTGPEPRTK